MGSGHGTRNSLDHFLKLQKEARGSKQPDTTAAPKPFVYPPLPSEDGLRLLILHPSNGQGILEGTLTSTTFASKPRYISLSYTWGAWGTASSGGGGQLPGPLVEDRPYILINGRPIEIGSNLADALFRLRSTLPLTLWVDQICINQADVAERNAQVALMAFIYSRAATVVSWLGQSSHGVPGKSTVAPHGLATGNLQFTKAELALSRTDPYWTRVWIVQEVCLARSIVFLTYDALWSEQQVTSWLRTDGFRSAGTSSNSAEGPMARLVKARTDRFSNSMRLEALIEQFMHCGCGEKRDRVYGLVGLANDVDSVSSVEEWKELMKDDVAGQPTRRRRGAILIDYDREYYDIWCDVVSLMHFHAKPQLDFGKAPHEMEDERKARLVRFAGIVQRALDGNVKTVPPSLRPVTGEPRMIVAKGYVAGRILSLGPTYTEFVGSFRSRQRWIGSWEGEYTQDHDLAKLREMEEKYEVKIVGYSKEELDLVVPIDSPGTVAWSPLHNEGTPAKSAAPVLPPADNANQRPDEPRRFLGDNLCMGMAPATTQVGDLVIRFWNCDAAIVVRQTTPAAEEAGENANAPNHSASYSLVGRADVAEHYKRENDHDHHAKDRMRIFNALYNGERYLAEGERIPRTAAMYVRLDFATLQNVTAGIGL